jgi:hypothetical protein
MPGTEQTKVEFAKYLYVEQERGGQFIILKLALLTEIWPLRRT